MVYSPNKKNILVIGAGIAGLAITGLLEKQGHRITLIEKKKYISDGSSICLPDNAMQHLRTLGILEDILSKSFRAYEWDVFTMNGIKIKNIVINDYFSSDRMFVATLRKDLHQSLMNLVSVGVTFNEEVNSIITKNKKYIVEMKSGGSSSFDLIIAADGIYSKTRAMLSPDITIDYLNVACYRGLIQNSSINKQVKFILCDSGFILLHPVNDAQLYCGIVFPCSKDKSLLDMSFSSVLNTLDNFINVPDYRQKTYWLPGYMETLSSSFFVKDNIAFIGDAAHGCATSLQQGAAQALEDAIILAESIQDNNDLQEALSIYKESREPNVKWIMHRSNDCMKILNNPLSTEEKNIRNETIAKEGLHNFVLWKELFNKYAL